MAPGHRCTICGGACRGGYDHSSLHLHVEIENLKQKLLERENHIVTMETNFLTEVDKFPNGEYAALADELVMWQEKYARLYEAHKRIQKVNQNLEDKLLKIVDKCETEKFNMVREVTNLKQRLADADVTMQTLREENERSRNDINIAIQLLQCKPSNFVSQKFESLPSDLQQKVKAYMASKKKTNDGSGTISRHEPKTIKVPISTFPPTAMFYSVNKLDEDEEVTSDDSGKPVDIVSAAIVAKILEERENERKTVKHCESCVCPARRSMKSCETQTNDLAGINISEADIIRVESYQSPLPSIGSVTLIERTPVIPLATVPPPLGPATTSRRTDGTTLNLGRNRYHSSKLSREVIRRREKPDMEHTIPRHSEIHIDDSGEVSCDITNVRLAFERATDVDSEHKITTLSNGRRCSISIHSGDNAAISIPHIPTQQTKIHHDFMHSSRSSSSSSAEERKPTETEI